MIALQSDQMDLLNPDDLEENLMENLHQISEWYFHRKDTWAWIYNCGLKKKLATNSDDTSHFELFGTEAVYRARYRGWFNPDRNTVTVHDRESNVRHLDQLPEGLYRALTSNFGKDVRIILP